MRPRPGDLVRLIDHNGDGWDNLAIFVSLSEVDLFWHWDVLVDGKLRHLNTSNWTLIPVERCTSIYNIV
jgi:hypothetical protein